MTAHDAVTVTGPGELAVAGRPLPDNPAWALVAVERAGLCGTDAKIVRGAIPVHYPRVLGHEIVGTVVRPGAGGRFDGRRVLVNPTIACGVCDVCRRDRSNLCPAGYSLGIGADGGMRRLLAVDQAQLHPLPESVSWDAAASLQVLGTCIHAQSVVDAGPQHVGVVVGLGVSGLLHVQLLRARGVRTVVGVTRSAHKRRVAEQLGATVTAAPGQALEVVARVTDGRMADVVVETVGAVDTFAQAIAAAGPGASVVVFGIISARSGRLPFSTLHDRELVVCAPRGARPRDYDAAVALVASGAVVTEPLLTSTWPLQRAGDALEAMTHPGQLKVAFDPASG